MYRMILAQRDKIQKEISMLNRMRYEEKDGKKINKQIEDLKKKYMYYNNLLKKV